MMIVVLLQPGLCGSSLLILQRVRRPSRSDVVESGIPKELVPVVWVEAESIPRTILPVIFFWSATIGQYSRGI